jgi:hypothetical protein
MRGDELRLTVDKLSGYNLRPVEELRQWRPDRKRPCQPIEGLAVYGGYICTQDRCDHCTRRIEKMHDHLPAHGKRASQHTSARPLWRACRLQTYFTAKGRIDYFVVEEEEEEEEEGREEEREGERPPLSLLPAPSQKEGKLFDDLKADIAQASHDLEGRAEIVQGVEDSRADRVPWLVRTGFPTHLQGLRDSEILSSYALPGTSLDIDGYGEDGDSDDGGGNGCVADLSRILTATDSMLKEAYASCSDTSPDGKMTQHRAKRLSNFRGGEYDMSNTNASKFRQFKNESSLRSYFRIAKQLITYYYRVVFLNDGHFSRDDDEHGGIQVPQDTIKATSWQQKAMQGVILALQRQDEVSRGRSGGNSSNREGDNNNDGEDDNNVELKCAIRAFYISLICHTVGSKPFRSPVLSFCAMLSRRKSLRRQGDAEQRMRCTWQEPGNFNSNLSILTWIAQVILFDFVCFKKQDDEDGIPDMIDDICKRYFQQMTETPFGHILQWRLYLFAASKTSMTKHQARWSLDKETIEYRGVELRMEHVSQLVASEFRQAHSLLYDELLFGMEDVAPIEPWRLHDDLDLDDYGASWMTHERNSEILTGTKDALLRQIEGRAALRRAFIRSDHHQSQSQGRGQDNSGDETRLCPKAMAIYEAHVQEFLKRMLTLIQVPAGPPLRSPELLSITYANTGIRRRSVLIWEKMVLIHVHYHKSQERTGTECDNIRFLPPAVGSLLLTYLAYVPNLRQVFLRQSKPGALLSPYLWSKPGGEVWEDQAVSSCLYRACARAKVPQFQVAWWRQVAASITKEKFSGKEQANFGLGEIIASEEVEDEAELAFLAGMSNHSFRTFNHAYAGSTTLTATNLLHRAYRASESWRTLFQIDQVLQGKRPRTVSETQSEGLLLQACKKTRFRARPTADESEITSIARRLHNDPQLQRP